MTFKSPTHLSIFVHALVFGLNFLLAKARLRPSCQQSQVACSQAQPCPRADGWDRMSTQPCHRFWVITCCTSDLFQACPYTSRDQLNPCSCLLSESQFSQLHGMCGQYTPENFDWAPVMKMDDHVYSFQFCFKCSAELHCIFVCDSCTQKCAQTC